VILTRALTNPFASFVVPAKTSRKLAPGLETDVVPPRTTRPVMLMLFEVSRISSRADNNTAYNISVPTLTNPMTSENSRESLLLVTPTVEVVS
jgi:hypothetical protein